MKYNELLININSEDGEKASAIAAMLDIGGLYLEDYSDMMDCDLVKQIGLIDEELLAKDTTKATLHVYLPENASVDEASAYLEERFTSENIKYDISHDLIDEEAYANSWKKYYKPLKIGEKIVVCPVWENYELKDGEVILKIDPGMAFGTGTHETTSLCIEYLQKVVNDGDKILDVGCGSGILGISAVKLGAKYAYLTDIDYVAVESAKHNSVLNDVQNKVTVAHSNLLDDASVCSDIMLANITADILAKLATSIPKNLKNKGVLILSGIIESKLNDVLKAYKEQNLTCINQIRKGEWFAVAFKRL